MRVVYITGEFPPMQGGVGDCTYEIAKALAARAAQVCVITSRQARGGKWTVPVEPVIERWDRRCCGSLTRLVRDRNPEIVHIQYQTAAYGMHPAINFLPLWLKRRVPSVKVVTTFHDLKVPYLFPKAGPLRGWVTFALAGWSDAVVATNVEDWERLSARRSGVLQIPIGSNIEPAPPRDYDRGAWRARLGSGPDDLLLSYFGFLNDSKGGETLVRALAEIPQAAAKLVMVGGQVGASDPTNLAYLARVRSLIAELGVSSRVLWTDYTPGPEVSANLLASDICVLPYRDGASFRRGSFMAALAHGLPIVTTVSPHPPAPSSRNHTGLTPVRTGEGEIVTTASPHPLAPPPEPTREEGGGSISQPALRDGENVLLVPPDDPHALAQAVLRLAASPELRARLSAGARELAQHFTWDKIAEQHLALYDRLAGRR